MAAGIAWQIILKGVNNQIAFNIIDREDPKKMWKKLTSIYSEISQGMVYSILQKLFNYSKINKFKRYDKSVIQIFAEVRYFYTCFEMAMTPRWDLWDMIAIFIALDTLYNHFETTTASLIKTRDKKIN